MLPGSKACQRILCGTNGSQRRRSKRGVGRRVSIKVYVLRVRRIKKKNRKKEKPKRLSRLNVRCGHHSAHYPVRSSSLDTNEVVDALIIVYAVILMIYCVITNL